MNTDPRQHRHPGTTRVQRIALVGLLVAFLTSGLAYFASAQKNSPMMAYHDFPLSKPTEAFQNVKELHLYVCNWRLGEGLPNLLKPRALAQESLKYIKMWIDSDTNVGLAIKFADGKKHEPIVTTEQPCEALYDSAMEEPGNLSLIVEVFPVLVGNTPHTTPPALAILNGFLYRPDHKRGIATMLRVRPQVIWDLQADEDTIRKEVNWNMGWRDDYGLYRDPWEPRY